MSGGTVCREAGHRHVVTARYGNASAFNGYRWQGSRYSAVVCLETSRVWRTTARYVASLPDATDEALGRRAQDHRPV